MKKKVVRRLKKYFNQDLKYDSRKINFLIRYLNIYPRGMLEGNYKYEGEIPSYKGRRHLRFHVHWDYCNAPDYVIVIYDDWEYYEGVTNEIYVTRKNTGYKLSDFIVQNRNSFWA